jgi:hypothetical protein
LAVFDPTMAFIERLSLRGEVCRARVARLWPWRWVGCP